MAHKVALVDDDRNILTSVSMSLEAEGFEVLLLKRPESAFAPARWNDHAHWLEQQLRLIDMIGLPNYLQSQMAEVTPNIV